MSKHIIKVVPYDSSWVKLFESEAEKIQKVLGDNCIAIHHVGSTSIPGLSAKPIIDIIPVVKDILKVDTEQLEALGYQGRGEFGMPFRRYFQKGAAPHTHHVHVWEEDNPEIEKHLLFCKYLRKHPADTKRYEQLKLKLAKDFREDRDSYTKSKDALIREIIQKSGFEGFSWVEAILDRDWAAYNHILKISESNQPAPKQENHFHFVFSKGIAIVGAAHVELLGNKRAKVHVLSIDEQYKDQGFEGIFSGLLDRWLEHREHSIKL